MSIGSAVDEDEGEDEDENEDEMGLFALFLSFVISPSRSLSTIKRWRDYFVQTSARSPLLEHGQSRKVPLLALSRLVRH